METKDEELVSLIARCAIRDQSALKVIYDRASPYLNAVAFRIVRSDELANEVLQEAFLQIWNNAEAYRPHMAKPLTWMTSIVRYRALDKLDREGKHLKQRVDDSHEVFDSLAGGDEPEQSAEQNLKDKHLQECMDKLSERARECLKLAYLQGYSREELAVKFNTNANTVKSWLRRGAERLKQCLSTKLQAT